jgi:hypothetical protein
MSCTDKPLAWSVVSTDGDNRLRCTVLSTGPTDPASEEVLLHAVRLEYFDSSVVDVPEVRVAITKLRALRAALGPWLELPLDELARHPFTLELDLSADSWNAFAIAFGVRDDLIIETGSTACTVEIRSAVFHAGMSFVVDPTTLGMLADDLDRVALPL